MATQADLDAIDVLIRGAMDFLSGARATTVRWRDREIRREVDLKPLLAYRNDLARSLSGAGCFEAMYPGSSLGT